MTNWRLIEDGAGDAAQNMAYDAALFEAVAGNAAPPLLRLYEWNRPSVSVGRFQSIERTVKAENCERLAIPIVRRITGGRGILHGYDLTISAAGIAEPGMNALAVYEWLAQGFIAAFRSIDIAAATGTCSARQPEETQGDCFACVSQADVVSAKTGRKLLGAALHLRQDAFLMQASIPLFREPSSITPAAVFRGQGSQTEDAMRGVSMPSLRRAVVEGFTSARIFRFNSPSEIDSLCAL